MNTNSYKYLHAILVIEDKTGRMGTLTRQLSYTCTKPLNKNGSAECFQRCKAPPKSLSHCNKARGWELAV